MLSKTYSIIGECKDASINVSFISKVTTKYISPPTIAHIDVKKQQDPSN